MLHEAYNLMYYFPDGVPQGANPPPAEIPLSEVLDNPNISDQWKAFLQRIWRKFGGRMRGRGVPSKAVEIMMSEIPPGATKELKAAKAEVFRLVTGNKGPPPTHCSAKLLSKHHAGYHYGKPTHS